MKLSVPDMSCGHCKAVVEKTIAEQDAGASVVIDLATRTAEVSTTAAPDRILAALAAQGYPAAIAG